MPAECREPAATTQQMSVELAHQTMQNHLACATDSCSQRREALRILVDEGRYTVAAR
jgi:hypothetical protein